ncbi:hypothetical protein ACFFRR_002637 [Megaselia abdita]
MSLLVDHILDNSYESIVILCKNYPNELFDVLLEVKLPVLIVNQDEEFHFNKHDETYIFQYPSRTAHQSAVEVNGVNKTYPILKFFMNHNFLTIIFSSFSMEVMKVLFNYQRSNRIFIVSENYTSISIELKNLYDAKFSNVIALDSENIYSMELFPVFKITKLSNLEFKNQFKDIHNYKVFLSFYPGKNRAVFYKDKSNKTVYGGFVVNCVKTFISYINGKTRIQQGESNALPGEKGVDFISGLIPSVNKESISDSPFLLRWGIMMPAPKEINSMLYLKAPIDDEVWIYYWGNILFTSIMLSVAARDTDWFKHFGSVLKATLGQSFEYHSERLRVMYILLIVFGFTIVTWYSALFGSFVTTVLYEKEIKSWDDIHNANYKITMFQQDFDTIKEIIMFRDGNYDLYDVVPSSEMSRRTFALDNRYGYILGNDAWDYFLNPLQKLYNIKKFVWLEKDYIVDHLYYVNVEENSIFKDALNEFIHKAQSGGFFVHWFKYSFIEKRREKNEFVYQPDKVFRVIDVNFLRYGFIILLGGNLAAFGALVIEIGVSLMKVLCRKALRNI